MALGNNADPAGLRPNLMRPKSVFLVWVVTLFLIPFKTSASTVFETTGTIRWIGSYNYSFDADVEPYTYQLTLSDLSVAPDEGFRLLYLSLTSDGQVIDSLFGPGSFLFEADPGGTYDANIFGVGGGNSWTGEFGLKVEAVPIPNTVVLLGFGILGLLLLRRKPIFK